MKNNSYKKVGKNGWLPFWFGAKFNKRAQEKKVRKMNKSYPQESDIT